MFIANAALGEGETLLILGLSRRNRERLEAGQPIDLSTKTHGLAIPTQLRIMIFAGDTEDSMAAQLKDLIGPTTIVGQRRPL